MNFNVEEIVFIINNVGVPIIILASLYYIIKKSVPNIFKVWENREKLQQEYYNKRNEQYDEQMNIMNKMMEQGNNALGQSTAALNQSTAVIERNTTIIDKAMVSNQKVIDSLDSMIKLTEKTHEYVTLHDRKADYISSSSIKTAERLEELNRKLLKYENIK